MMIRNHFCSGANYLLRLSKSRSNGCNGISLQKLPLELSCNQFKRTNSTSVQRSTEITKDKAAKKQNVNHAQSLASLQSSTTLENIMSLWKRQKYDEKSIPHILPNLCRVIGSTDHITLQTENESFEIFGEKLISGLGDLPLWAYHYAIVLYTNAADEDFSIAKALLKNLQLNISSFSLQELVKMETLLKDTHETSLRKETLGHLANEIAYRCDFRTREASPKLASDLIAMMSMALQDTQSSHKNTPNVANIEELYDKAAEMVPHMQQFYQLQTILSMLARHRQRPSPLIQSVITALNQRSWLHIQFKGACNLLYSCVVLNIYDEQLIGNICERVVANLQSLRMDQVVLLPKFLQSLSRLRWRDPVVINSVTDAWFIHRDIEDWEAQDYNAFHDILRSCAHLQHIPDSLNQVISLHGDCMGKVQSHFEAKEPMKWLDTVTSLGVIQQMTDTEAESVLNNAFREKISVKSKQSYFSKLVTVNACACLDLPDYTGATLSAESIAQFTATLRKEQSKITPAERRLFAAFNSMGADLNYVKTNTYTSLGHHIDAECHINSKGELQPLVEEGQLPAAHRRLAIKMIDFKHKTLSTDLLIAEINTVVRHLQKLHFTPVLIDINTFNSLGKDLDRVSFLQAQLKASSTNSSKKMKK